MKPNEYPRRDARWVFYFQEVNKFDISVSGGKVVRLSLMLSMDNEVQRIFQGECALDFYF
ncbi:MAG: hypothetical protein V2A70_05935 [Candidatus Omnitrophota bacterium]